MILNLNKESFLTFDLNKRFKEYNLNLKVKSNYLNYETFSKIKYDELVTIIENIENMFFCKYKYGRNIELKRVKMKFYELETRMKIIIDLGDRQEYAISLNREQVINLYNYLTSELKTVNKVKMMDFNKKYTYVEVRYIDVYSSRRYSYISDDKRIRVGDVVYVDRAGTKCLAVVENKGEYYYEDAPYPVLETKRVIKVVTRAKEYKAL
ncbi:MAG: hypothetical protein IJ217_01495 [Clostridia bacterium]|nr:hypothetical protein [Clostridia bacterium]